MHTNITVALKPNLISAAPCCYGLYLRKNCSNLIASHCMYV